MRTDTAFCATTELPPAPDPGMEHRFGRRLPCGTRVELRGSEGLTGHGRMRDVSLSGAYVQTTLPPPVAAIVTLVKTCTDRPPIEMRAWVVRRDAHGVGIEWCDSPARPICETLGCAQPCLAAQLAMRT